MENVSIMLNEIPVDDSPADASIHDRIARRVRTLRAARGDTLEALALRSGVSRSMISLIERGAASPTAVVLDKLAAGLGVPLARLFELADGEGEVQPLAHRADQAVWRDPASGYLRRSLSPPGWPSPLQLVEVEFPPGARVAYESSARELPPQQQLWLLDGRLDVTLGDQRHALHAGDCLAMRLDRPLVDRKSTRLNSSHNPASRMPSSA
jgi:transcriptional regulator with XRE-family HTH domain